MEPIALPRNRDILSRGVSQDSPFNAIPAEIILVIFSWLNDNSSVSAVMLTCKRFHRMMSSDHTIKMACARRYFLSAKAACHIRMPHYLLDQHTIAAKKFFSQEDQVNTLAIDKLDLFIQEIKCSKQYLKEHKRKRKFFYALQAASATAIICGGQFGLLACFTLIYNKAVHGDFNGRTTV